jgi:dTDP-4-amino-4,6-dideoxygalactose transaminase
MRVPLLDLGPQHQLLREQLLVAIERVIDSQRFVLGDEVRVFENEVARYCTSKHAVGCASGSDALLLALMALGVRDGDEIITSPFTFFATAGSIARLGARPVFVDIDPLTYNIDVEQVESAISPRTRAILPIHLYGQCAEMDRLIEISTRHEIPIIEDAAQAMGAEYQGRRAGSMGLIGCFSFYPTKNLGGAGDGGMLTTDNNDLAKRLRMLRTHGGKTEYEHSEIGINSRLDAIQAAVLRVKLHCLDTWSEERRKRAELYTELLRQADLTTKVAPPCVQTQSRHIFHQYVIRVPKHRDALKDHLAQWGVGTKVYYPVPLHLQKCFDYLGYKKGDFPEAERAALETLALPLYPEITDDQQRYVVDIARQFKVGRE